MYKYDRSTKSNAGIVSPGRFGPMPPGRKITWLPAKRIKLLRIARPRASSRGPRKNCNSVYEGQCTK